jgi:hypothetical protein
MGGIVPKVIFGYWEDVAVWPTIPDLSSGATTTGISLAEAGAMVDDLQMVDGTCAYTLEFNDEAGSFQIAPQGDKGNISFLYTLTFINKRIRDKVLGFLNAAKNRKMFFIVQDNNGQWYLMGDKLRGAMLAPSDGAVTGTATTDSNQVTSVFTYVSTGAYRYDGDTEEILEIASGD